MDILWFLIGVIVGALVAWLYFSWRFKKNSAKREADFRLEKRNFQAAAEGEREAHKKTRNLLSELEAKKSSAVDQIAVLDSELAALGQQLEVERSEHDKSKLRLSELEAQNSSAAERSESLETELNTMRAQLDRSKTADAANIDKLNQLQSNSENLRSRLDEEQALLENLERQLREAQTERSTVADENQSRIDELQEVLRQRDETLEALHAKLATIQTQSENQRIGAISDPPSETPSTSDAIVPAGDTRDDLTKIKGIGPVLEGKLHKLGFTTFRQIAEFTQADIERVNAVLNFPGRIEREKWVAQARAMTNR